MTTTEPAYTPDPADVELVAKANFASDYPTIGGSFPWDDTTESEREDYRRSARDILSALAAAGRLLPPARVGCPHCGRTSHGFVCQESMKANGQWQGTP